MKKSLYVLLIGIALTATSAMAASASASASAPAEAVYKPQETPDCTESAATCHLHHRAFKRCSRSKTEEAFDECLTKFLNTHTVKCDMESSDKRKQDECNATNKGKVAD
jgi:curli biogenesis system outer membrane secretion channel CsgG